MSIPGDGVKYLTFNVWTKKYDNHKVVIFTQHFFPSVTGQYGQLGHGSKCSSDEPKVVEYFSNGGMFVEDVVCGFWNTFVSAVSTLCPTH